MSGNNTQVSSPVLIGADGSKCANCSESDGPLYALPGHGSNKPICRDCLTENFAKFKTFKSSQCISDTNVDFKPVIPLDDRDLHSNYPDQQGLDEYRQQHWIMNGKLSYTRGEAFHFMRHVLSIAANQRLDYEDAGVRNCEMFIYRWITYEIANSHELTTTPLQLQEDLLSLLNYYILIVARIHYPLQMRDAGLDISDASVDNWKAQNIPGAEEYIRSFSVTKAVHDAWSERIKAVIGLLTWRHLERTKATASQDVDLKFKALFL